MSVNLDVQAQLLKRKLHSFRPELASYSLTMEGFLYLVPNAQKIVLSIYPQILSRYNLSLEMLPNYILVSLLRHLSIYFSYDSFRFLEVPISIEVFKRFNPIPYDQTGVRNFSATFYRDLLSFAANPLSLVMSKLILEYQTLSLEQYFNSPDTGILFSYSVC